jgi:hypothetical protein
MRPNFHLGVYLNFPVNDQVSIQTEALFNSMGTIKDYDSDDLDSAGNYQYDYSVFVLNYVSIPVMVKYAFGPMSVHVGPQISLLARALSKSQSLTFDAASGYVIDDRTRDVQHNFKLVDFSLNGGIGLDLDAFNACIRYSYGISNIAARGETKMKNSNIQLSVGYRLSAGY